MKISILIRFEGAQGSGKTTIANLISDFLLSKGLTSILLENSHAMSVVGNLPDIKENSGQLTINFEKEMKR